MIKIDSNRDLLLGEWIEDINVQYKREYSEIYFGDDGSLIYSIYTNNQIQKIFLSYEIEGDTLITDQPSSPSIVRSKFLITPDRKLIITHDSESTCYRKK